MHEIQKKLLTLAAHNDISQLSYGKLAKRVGAEHPAQVRHHLLQLEKEGKIVRKADGSLVTSEDATIPAGGLLSIPILGEVDCGVATRFAADNLEGYLSISPSTTRCKDINGVFALMACGNSMNRADIFGKSVYDSDYVLVKKYEGEGVRDGEYVVSLIDGMANLKKFRNDETHHRIALLSESSEDYPPILIADTDTEYYEVIGKPVDVINGVGHLN